ncbi:MAG: hypothetical protein ACXQS8_06365 [Candidatus Helarchaeales archaeon]
MNEFDELKESIKKKLEKDGLEFLTEALTYLIIQLEAGLILTGRLEEKKEYFT